MPTQSVPPARHHPLEEPWPLTGSTSFALDVSVGVEPDDTDI